MSMTWRLVGAAAVGTALGWIGALVPALGWWTLLPWGIVGGLLGFAMRRPALIGVIYGFFLSFSFMMAGYTGTASRLSRIPGFALLAAGGAVAGLIVAVLGAAIAARGARQQHRATMPPDER